MDHRSRPLVRRLAGARGPSAASCAAQRRRARRLALLAPALCVLAMDLAARGQRILAFQWFGANVQSLGDGLRAAHAPAYWASALGSAVVWGSLLFLACARPPLVRRLAALSFVALFSVSVGVQAAFRHRFGIYLSRDGAELCERPLLAALGNLRPGLLPFASLAAAFTVACLLLYLARRVVRVQRRARHIASALCLVAWTGALLVPVSYRQWQSTTPDLIWINAVSVMARNHAELVERGEASMQPRTPREVGRLPAAPARPRNVILILQESLRADVTCIEYDPACARATRATNAAAPGRLPLLNVRANGSATAVAMAVLFTGLDPTAPQARLLEAPTLWEYAHAAGYDTAYFGSQHLMFANMWLWVEDVPSGRITLGTHLDAQADMFAGADDGELSRSVAAALPALREPFFAVVHYANVHTPRRWDPEPGPFTPAREDKADRGEYFNGYKNAVHRSDRAVAELIRALRASPAGPRTVVVFTADHGEAMWEHGQGCDHGCTLFDEETRVPAWIDAPDETLSPAERAAIAAARGAPLFHVDLAATLLDLLGVWDAPALAPFRRSMLGQPITRPGREERTIPLSNVSHVWERGLPSYGLMRGRLKLAGRHRDPGFSCFDVEADPEETRSLPEACAELQRAAMKVYGRPPSDFDRLVFHPEWGPFIRE